MAPGGASVRIVLDVTPATFLRRCGMRRDQARDPSAKTLDRNGHSPTSCHAIVISVATGSLAERYARTTPAVGMGQMSIQAPPAGKLDQAMTTTSAS